MTEPRPLTLGTAGHVDHGKTALVGALTGVDTDRLREEKERGLSIALGYAPLGLPSGRRLSVVDVPGHERFVRTMVAGATGIDLFLLCVAADDGVMPQTREHIAVLRALGVKRGVVAITKSDLSDPKPAIDEVGELLPGVEAVPVAAPTGAGLDLLLGALDRVAAAIPERGEADGPVRLHVDRSFTLKGIGTVVTGTLWSGRFATGDKVRLLPQDKAARIRSIQVHGNPVSEALAGQRVALALTGIGHREVRRGDVVCGPDSELRATYAVTASVALDPGSAPLTRGARVQVHHGTRETAARVSPLEGEVCRLRLEAPLVAYRGDRLVLRQIAPPITVGGGEVVDAAGRKRSGCPRRSSGPGLLDAPNRPLSVTRRPGWRSCCASTANGRAPTASWGRLRASRHRPPRGRGVPSRGQASRCGPVPTCTFTVSSWTSWPSASWRSAGARGASRLPRCATSWARAAATRRPWSSTSTRSS